MEDNRRKFIQKACFAGACLCGFASIAKPASSIENQNTEPDRDKMLMHDWISVLLGSIDDQADEATCRTIMRNCAIAHYNHMQMDNTLEPYIGDLEKFLGLMKEKWGWKIDYQKEAGTIIANENKNYCVCPMVAREKGVKSSVLCYCAEGFTEMMFSKVVGHPLKAEVISSVLRGDAGCKYKITLA
jgi:hypothetical protein